MSRRPAAVLVILVACNPARIQLASMPTPPAREALTARWRGPDEAACPPGHSVRRHGPFPATAYCVDEAGVMDGPTYIAVRLHDGQGGVAGQLCAGRRCGEWTAWNARGSAIGMWRFADDGTVTRTYSVPGYEDLPEPPLPPPVRPGASTITDSDAPPGAPN